MNSKRYSNLKLIPRILRIYETYFFKLEQTEYLFLVGLSQTAQIHTVYFCMFFFKTSVTVLRDLEEKMSRIYMAAFVEEADWNCGHSRNEPIRFEHFALCAFAKRKCEHSPNTHAQDETKITCKCTFKNNYLPVPILILQKQIKRKFSSLYFLRGLSIARKIIKKTKKCKMEKSLRIKKENARQE